MLATLTTYLILLADVPATAPAKLDIPPVVKKEEKDPITHEMLEQLLKAWIVELRAKMQLDEATKARQGTQETIKIACAAENKDVAENPVTHNPQCVAKPDDKTKPK